MQAEFIKELLGSQAAECTDENFKLGYNPITDIIDQYEVELELSINEEKTEEEFCQESWGKTESFLFKMDYVRRTHKNYSTIYNIDFYGNSFYYSKEADDAFFETWKTWNGDHLDGGKTRTWFYYFINLNIIEELQEKQKNGSLTEQRLEELCEEEIADEMLYEIENKCIQSSDIPEIQEAECFFEEQRDEMYGWEYERDLRRLTYWEDVEMQRELENAEELICELESQSIEPDEN